MDYRKSFLHELSEAQDERIHPCFDGDWLVEELQTHGFRMLRSELTMSSYKTVFQKKTNLMDSRFYQHA